VLLGSGNWDPRSLELNFELDVECYDPTLAGELEELVAGVRQQARRVTVGEWAKRGLAVRLRDGVARLFAPYL
jgi:cardiolipin synthase